MSWGGVPLEWLILDKQTRLKLDEDERLVEQIDEYVNNEIKLDLVLAEIRCRPDLYERLKKERPELWV